MPSWILAYILGTIEAITFGIWVYKRGWKFRGVREFGIAVAIAFLSDSCRPILSHAGVSTEWVSNVYNPCEAIFFLSGFAWFSPPKNARITRLLLVAYLVFWILYTLMHGIRSSDMVTVTVLGVLYIIALMPVLKRMALGSEPILRLPEFYISLAVFIGSFITLIPWSLIETSRQAGDPTFWTLRIFLSFGSAVSLILFSVGFLCQEK